MTTIMESTDVSFEKQINGYDREQVDKYIANLTQAYQTAYDEFTALSVKYDELLRINYELKEQRQNTPNADVIARALVNAEILAQKTIEDAKADAAKMTADAQTDSKKIVDDAYVEKAKTKLQAEQILEDAKAEAARLIEGAHQELMITQNKKARLISEISSILDKLKILGDANGASPYP